MEKLMVAKTDDWGLTDSDVEDWRVAMSVHQEWVDQTNPHLLRLYADKESQNRDFIEDEISEIKETTAYLLDPFFFEEDLSLPTPYIR